MGIPFVTEELPFSLEEDVWSRRCFCVASAALEPMCTAVWCGFRILAPLGKFDCKANRVHEIALCALYFLTAALLVIPGIPLAGISQIFRCVGRALQSNGCTHVKGDAPEKDFSSSDQITVMTFNIAAVPGGISYKVAGVPKWRLRMDGIVDRIRTEDPDVLVIQEAYDTAAQEELVRRLKDLYPHFFLHLGVGSLGGLGPGGVMMMTKSAVSHFSDHPFNNNPVTQCRSFGCIELLKKPGAVQPFVRVIGTHPAWRETEVKERGQQWQQIREYITERNKAQDYLPTLVAADTNCERDREEGLELQTWMQPCYRDLPPTGWYQFSMAWDPASTLFQSHENYQEYGKYAVYRPRQIDNIWLVQEGDEMRLDSCHLVHCYDDPYSGTSRWFDNQTAISDHHGVVAKIKILAYSLINQ